MSDPIADALIRIKNGYLSYKETVVLPYSKIIESICGVLKTAGYITDFKVEDSARNEKIKQINTTLKYADRKGVMTEVKRISKPGLRIYKNKKSLPYVLNGLGIAIISTPRGVMTDKQARKEGIGGEILAYVW
jgi:small subunit ribosomal protein S8